MRRSLVLLLTAATLAAACTGTQVDATETAPPEQAVDPVRVASGPDPETLLLAHTYAAAVELEGQPAEVVTFSDTRDARRALELGDVHVHPGYTGEAWLEVLGRADPPGDLQESFTAVRLADQDRGIVWIRPRFELPSIDGGEQAPANATFAFVVAGPPSIDADLRTMSQLAARLSEQPDAAVCVDNEFGTRVDGLRAVLTAYSVRSDRAFVAATPEEAVRGVASGDCIAGLTTATDGAAWRAGLRPLVDDLRVFPAFVPVPTMRQDAIDRWPEVRRALGPAATELSTELLGRSNARVAGGETAEVVGAELAQLLRDRAEQRRPAAPPDR